MTILTTLKTAPAPTPAGAPVVEVRGVSKTYPGAPPVTALHPSWLRVDAGDQLAIVGASGSGKSTLLSILGAIDDPTGGTVLVDGQDLGAMREGERSAIRAARISFVFQQFHLLPTVSATENVATGLLYTGVSPVERRERAVAALEAVGLGRRLRNRPGELSGGEQQRVAIARALVREPAVLFADEPTGALDSATGEAIIALLGEIAQSGTAVVMVTHNAGLAERFPRRIRLRDGRIIGRQPAEADPTAGRKPAVREESSR
jgi:putative ABC transport system ATP-binding protein